MAGWIRRLVDGGRGVSVRRSFAFATVGALAGLATAGYALFTARGTATVIVPAEDVATVNAQPIARSDYRASLQALYGAAGAEADAAQRRQALDDLIREELFVQRAKELDVAAFDPEVRAAMVRSVEESAAADAVTRVPDESQLRAYFEANRDRYASEGMMTLRDFVFPPRRGAAAAEALTHGALPDEVLARFGGRDSRAVKGEEFYFAARIHLGEPLFAAARSLPTGGVGGPLGAPEGEHVLFMVENRAPVPLSFERARARIRSDYTQEAIKRLQAQQAEFLRKRANVRVAEDLN
ncbi:MAG: peptidyl-prolyl cis-trans isomerase [Gammaproteobacteria bacterium]|nr:peptidyl-prolyl cis-trans isomerase [Gammaproteobacteria bacterium]